MWRHLLSPHSNNTNNPLAFLLSYLDFYCIIETWLRLVRGQYLQRFLLRVEGIWSLCGHVDFTRNGAKTVRVTRGKLSGTRRKKTRLSSVSILSCGSCRRWRPETGRRHRAAWSRLQTTEYDSSGLIQHSKRCWVRSEWRGRPPMNPEFWSSDLPTPPSATSNWCRS